MKMPDRPHRENPRCSNHWEAEAEQEPQLMLELAAINNKLAAIMTIHAKVESIMSIKDTVDQNKSR